MHILGLGNSWCNETLDVSSEAITSWHTQQLGAMECSGGGTQRKMFIVTYRSLFTPLFPWLLLFHLRIFFRLFVSRKIWQVELVTPNFLSECLAHYANSGRLGKSFERKTSFIWLETWDASKNVWREYWFFWLLIAIMWFFNCSPLKFLEQISGWKLLSSKCSATYCYTSQCIPRKKNHFRRK